MADPRQGVLGRLLRLGDGGIARERWEGGGSGVRVRVGGDRGNLRRMVPGLRRWRLVAGLGAAVLLAAACGDDGGSGDLTVFAAASLTDAFSELADAFEDDHPGVAVALGFAGSSSLREQILAGAPADVLAAADEASVQAIVDAGEAEGSVVFARNRVQLAVPRGNPEGVTSLEDLARDDLLVGLCAEPVPCGRLARDALRAADVDAAVDTEEPDVRALLTKVAEGELDAGIVYETDVVAADGEVEVVDIPTANDVTARYPITVLERTDDRELAEAFVAFVASEAGQRVLLEHGFGLP